MTDARWFAASDSITLREARQVILTLTDGGPDDWDSAAERKAILLLALSVLIARAIRCLEAKYLVGRDVLTSPAATRDCLKLRLDGVPYEVFETTFDEATRKAIAGRKYTRAKRRAGWHIF